MEEVGQRLSPSEVDVDDDVVEAILVLLLLDATGDSALVDEIDGTSLLGLTLGRGGRGGGGGGGWGMLGSGGRGLW